MPVGELLARTSSRELTEWAAFEQECGPLGPERGDYQAALIAQTTATMLGSGKGRVPRIQDFLLRWAPRRPQTVEEQLNIFRALASRKKD